MDDEPLGGGGGLELPGGEGWKRAARGGLQVAAGAIPFAGGLFSAAAGFWSEKEQARVNEFILAWIRMLKDEFHEKEETLIGIVTRLNMQDEKIAERVRSEEFQTLVRKAFRKWAGAESAKKREYIRNILSNAASTDLTSDDVISLFLDWLNTYSEFHFSVIADIYHHSGTTRRQTWMRLGKEIPREDSAEADLFKLLIRDLSMGSVIRQHRETDYYGNFVAKPKARPTPNNVQKPLKSAFDDGEQYEVTALGSQFVHYAMQELTTKISYEPPNHTTEG